MARPRRPGVRVLRRADAAPFLWVRDARVAIAGWARLVAELAPARTLRRGFSITRDAAGVVLRDPAAVAAGSAILTELAGGQLRSRVESADRITADTMPDREKQ